MHIGVISFPGSNGDHDALASLESDLGATVRRVDYREQSLSGLDAVVLPGGFSYGDALRCGAIAQFAPIMESVQRAAAEEMPILGICNGFQVLCEAHLLPGALLSNKTLRFHCNWTHIRIEQDDTSWTHALDNGEILNLPVAHGDGAYFIGDTQLEQIEAKGQVVARYCSLQGEIIGEANANGSVANIAAVCNEKKNVVGLMPHPERATNDLVGGTDGLKLLKSILATTTTA